MECSLLDEPKDNEEKFKRLQFGTCSRSEIHLGSDDCNLLSVSLQPFCNLF